MADTSRALTRTVMAWQRTALALGVLAAIAIKLTMVDHSWIGLWSSVIALIGALLLYVISYQKRSGLSPLVSLGTTTVVICLLGIAAWVQIV